MDVKCKFFFNQAVSVFNSTAKLAVLTWQSMFWSQDRVVRTRFTTKCTFVVELQSGSGMFAVCVKHDPFRFS